MNQRRSQVVLPGLEPRQAEPKTAVLPLHHKTILIAQDFRPKALQRYAQFFCCANILQLFLKYFLLRN